MTDFNSMTHEQIYKIIVTDGEPGSLKSTQAAVEDLHKTLTSHLDEMTSMLRSVADAWPDANGDRFRSTTQKVIDYVRDLGQTHVVAASTSIASVIHASQSKLSTTQSGMPEPPAVPIATQQAHLNQQYKEQDGANSMATVQASQRLSAARSADAKAVQMATALASEYRTQKSQLATPPQAPTGPNPNGNSGGSTPSGSSSSTHTMASSSSVSSHPTSVSTFHQTHGQDELTNDPHIPIELPPPWAVDNGNDGTDWTSTGPDNYSSFSDAGLSDGGGGTDAMGAGSGDSGSSFPVTPVLGAGALAAAGAAGMAAMSRRGMSAEQAAALAAQQERAAMAAGRGVIGSTMSAEQRALLAQRNGAAMSAEEQALLRQRTVAGQLGASGAQATGRGAAGRPFMPHGVVGGEGEDRVTWLTEDRDLWSADPGVRPVVDE